MFLPLVGGRKEMFYLTTHSTHYIYGYMALDAIGCVKKARFAVIVNI